MFRCGAPSGRGGGRRHSMMAVRRTLAVAALLVLTGLLGTAGAAATTGGTGTTSAPSTTQRTSTTPATQATLGSRQLKYGMRGPDVTTLQQWLKAMHYKVRITGR